MENLMLYNRALLEGGEGSDFTIVVTNEECVTERKAHKLMLRRCPYFSALLDSPTLEAKHGLLKLTADVSNVDAVLRYLYYGDTAVPLKSIPSLVAFLDYLQLTEFRDTMVAHYANSFGPTGDIMDQLQEMDNLISSGYDSSFSADVINDIWVNLASRTLTWQGHDVLSPAFYSAYLARFGARTPAACCAKLLHWVDADPAARRQLAISEFVRLIDFTFVPLADVMKMALAGLLTNDTTMETIKPRFVGNRSLITLGKIYRAPVQIWRNDVVELMFEDRTWSVVFRCFGSAPHAQIRMVSVPNFLIESKTFSVSFVGTPLTFPLYSSHSQVAQPTVSKTTLQHKDGSLHFVLTLSPEKPATAPPRPPPSAPMPAAKKQRTK